MLSWTSTTITLLFTHVLCASAFNNGKKNEIKSYKIVGPFSYWTFLQIRVMRLGLCCLTPLSTIFQVYRGG